MECNFSWNKNVANASIEFTRESPRVFQLIQIQWMPEWAVQWRAFIEMLKVSRQDFFFVILVHISPLLCYDPVWWRTAVRHHTCSETQTVWYTSDVGCLKMHLNCQSNNGPLKSLKRVVVVLRERRCIPALTSPPQVKMEGIMCPSHLTS